MRTAMRTALTLTAIVLALLGPAGAAGADGVLGGLLQPAGSSATTQGPLSSLVQTVTQPAQTAGTVTQQGSAQAPTPLASAVATVTQPLQPVTAPVATTVAGAVETVTQPVATLTQPLQPVTAPVATTVAGAVETVTQPVATLTQPLQPVTAPVAGAVETVTKPVATLTQPLQPVTAPVAGAVETVTKPVATLTQPLQPVTAPVATTVTGVIQALPSTPRPVTQQIAPSSPRGPAPPVTGTTAASDRDVSGGSAAPQATGLVPAPAVKSVPATALDERAGAPLRAKPGAQPTGRPRVLSPRPVAASRPEPVQPLAGAVSPARTRTETIADPWLVPAARPIPTPALEREPAAAPQGYRLIGVTDASAAIRLGLFWAAALLLALGAAPTRAATGFGRWPSLAFDRYRAYALGGGFALLAGAAITGL